VKAFSTPKERGGLLFDPKKNLVKERTYQQQKEDEAEADRLRKWALHFRERGELYNANDLHPEDLRPAAPRHSNWENID